MRIISFLLVSCLLLNVLLENISLMNVETSRWSVSLLHVQCIYSGTVVQTLSGTIVSTRVLQVFPLKKKQSDIHLL